MRIDGHTRLAFLLGHPVGHSASPAMHQAAIASTGLNAVYLPWPVTPARLEWAVQGLRSMENLLGANVTIPHKERMLTLVDALTPEAEAIGAVNTVLVREGRLIGDNTDGQGFLTALQQDLSCDPRGMTAVILGAGGAARAVAVSLARAGAARLILLNRNLERARDLAQVVAARYPSCTLMAQALHSSWRLDQATEIRLLINTTSVGLEPTDPPLFDYASLDPAMAVYDLIYNPPQTLLLRTARARGCRTGNGSAMLVHQGALAFERWTGIPAPVEAMRNALGLGENDFSAISG